MITWGSNILRGTYTSSFEVSGEALDLSGSLSGATLLREIEQAAWDAARSECRKTGMKRRLEIRSRKLSFDKHAQKGDRVEIHTLVTHKSLSWLTLEILAVVQGKKKRPVRVCTAVFQIEILKDIPSYPRTYQIN